MPIWFGDVETFATGAGVCGAAQVAELCRRWQSHSSHALRPLDSAAPSDRGSQTAASIVPNVVASL